MDIDQIVDALHTRRSDLEIILAGVDSVDLENELHDVTAMLDLYYKLTQFDNLASCLP